MMNAFSPFFLSCLNRAALLTPRPLQSLNPVSVFFVVGLYYVLQTYIQIVSLSSKHVTIISFSSLFIFFQTNRSIEKETNKQRHRYRQTQTDTEREAKQKQKHVSGPSYMVIAQDYYRFCLISVRSTSFGPTRLSNLQHVIISNACIFFSNFLCTSRFQCHKSQKAVFMLFILFI